MFGRPLNGRPLGGRPLGARQLGRRNVIASLSEGGGDGVPSWVPPGATGWADFVNAQYWDETNGETDFDTLFDFSRSAATVYAADSDDDFTAFTANEARITDLGLLYEPAQTYLITNSFALSQTGWSDGGVSSAQNTGPWAALFVDGRTVTSTGNVNGGRQLDLTSFFTASSPVTFSIRYVLGTSGKLMARFVDTGTFQASKIQFNGTSSSSVASDAGTFSDIVDIAHDDHRELQFVFTPDFTGNLRMALGPDSSSAGQTCVVIGAEAVAGTLSPYSPFPAAGARPADALTIHLGDDNHDLTLTFDDDSTEEINGETGDYALPTSIDRPRVKSIDWRAV